MNKAAMIRGLFVGDGNGGRHKWRSYIFVGCAFMRTWYKTAMKLLTRSGKASPKSKASEPWTKTPGAFLHNAKHCPLAGEPHG
jgi:hypothetical protein